MTVFANKKNHCLFGYVVMASKINLVCDVNSNKVKWNLKVLVVRLWNVADFEKLDVTYTTKMVLQDENIVMVALYIIC